MSTERASRTTKTTGYPKRFGYFITTPTTIGHVGGNATQVEQSL